MLAYLAAVVWSSATPSRASGATDSAITIAPFGELAIYRPPAEIESVVLFISGDGGWMLPRVLVDVSLPIAGGPRGLMMD